MPIITIPSIEVNETSARITRTIKGLEMVHGRLGAETDLQYVKRLFMEMLKDAYRRKRDAENAEAALLADSSEINPT